MKKITGHNQNIGYPDCNLQELCFGMFKRCTNSCASDLMTNEFSFHKKIMCGM